MKTYKRNIYKIDRIFYNVKESAFLGDMASTFCDSDDTRTTDESEARAGALYSLRAAIEAGEEEHNSAEEIAIYQALQTVATYEADDDESETDAAGALLFWNPGAWSVVSSFVACSEEYAHAVGLPVEDLASISYYEK